MSAKGRPERELLPPGGKARSAKGAPASAATVAVTVVWATPEVQDSVPLTLPAGATVAAAIAQSGLVERYGIDRGAVHPAVHGRLVRDDAALRAGDRVEICRPLCVDPKAARRLRAAARERGGTKRTAG